jgi:hypothetical protein
MRNRLKFTAFRHVAITASIAASFVGCSLFVPLGDLNDHKGEDASTDASPLIDATAYDAATDASIDASSDAGVPYFVVDDCVDDSTDVVNLTTAGSIDWMHWGSDADEKNVSSHVLGMLMESTGGMSTYSDDTRSFSWTDGTNNAVVTSTTDGALDTIGPMTLTANASATRQALTLYIDGFDTESELAVLLSPGAPVVSQSFSSFGSDAERLRCVIHFASPVPATVQVTFSLLDDDDSGTPGYSNVAAIAATVAPDHE